MQLEATRQANELVGLFMALKPLKVSVNCFRTSALASSASSTAAAAFSSEIAFTLAHPGVVCALEAETEGPQGLPGIVRGTAARRSAACKAGQDFLQQSHQMFGLPPMAFDSELDSSDISGLTARLDQKLHQK